MTKHTEGPWKAGAQNPTSNEIQIMAGKSIVAHVAPRPHWDATQESNAALLASAPELLGALKALLELHKVHRDQMVHVYARAVIAKAEWRD